MGARPVLPGGAQFFIGCMSQPHSGQPRKALRLGAAKGFCDPWIPVGHAGFGLVSARFVGNDAIETLEAHPETPGAIVDYRDLTSDPAATIEKLYADLDLEMTEDYRAELAKQGKRERKHTTDHEYSLEEFGLEADEIRTRLGDLFDRFGWDENEAPEGGESASA